MVFFRNSKIFIISLVILSGGICGASIAGAPIPAGKATKHLVTKNSGAKQVNPNRLQVLRPRQIGPKISTADSPKFLAEPPMILRFDWYGPNDLDPFRVFPGESIEFTIQILGPQNKDVIVQLNSSNRFAVPVPGSITIPKGSGDILTKRFTITIPFSVVPPQTSSVTASTTADSKLSVVAVVTSPEEEQ